MNFRPTLNRNLLKSTLGALGIVYGDIGTSPLYALRECFHSSYGIVLQPANILGILSLLFWSLMIVISLKYVTFIMRVDNRGEGGILALLALTLREKGVIASGYRKRWWLITMGIFGAALFYGDGMITPAISVLSAVEGLNIASPLLEAYTIPLTIAIVSGLFLIQQKGTEKVGALFGPIMVIWFSVLALMGIWNIAQQPSVLQAINPLYAVHFFIFNQWHGFLVLAAVMLVVTGGEALYADMGHFGRRPIRLAWFYFVLPALLLNYFGQGALLIHHPEALENPFYHMIPSWGLYPLILLATVATIIASQAVISGTFSLTRQAIQLGYCPRLEIIHTSADEIGQIYIPWINWVLLIAIIGLILGFQSSSNLAAAYGIAVTGTMLITTILAFIALRSLWGWHRLITSGMIILFLSIDLAFLGANTSKIVAGGWFPLLIALLLFTLMSTWKRGREILSERISPDLHPTEFLISMITNYPPLRVPGTAIFMTSNLDGIPTALLHNLKHNKVLHERIVFLTILTEEVPWIAENERLSVQDLGYNVYRLIGRYGFIEDPQVIKLLEQAKEFELEFDLMETTFFLAQETLIPSKKHPAMALWREKLFIGMLRNARSATDFFKIPSNRVIEIGSQINL